MAFTDNSDIFASFHEEGFNRILQHVRRQRPSLFNYATRQIAADPQLLCQAIKSHPIVGIRSNPLITIEDPLPIPGTNYGLNFAVQIVDLRIDFHPGNQFGLPPQLAPLKKQRLAIFVRLCAGLGCPPHEIIDKFIPPPDRPRHNNDVRREQPPARDIVVLPTRELHCFCLDVFAVGGVRIREYYGKPYLEPFIDGVEIVDIKPTPLENSIECYILLLLKLSILPKLRVLLEKSPLELMKNVKVLIKPTPISGKVPNNPAIEQDQLKAFINVEVI